MPRPTQKWAAAVILAATLWPQWGHAARVGSATEGATMRTDGTAVALAASSQAKHVRASSTLHARRMRTRARCRGNTWNHRHHRKVKKRSSSVLQGTLHDSPDTPPEEGEEAEEEEAEEEEEPWQMSKWDKIGLQVGWLAVFAAILLAILTFTHVGELLSKPPEGTPQDLKGAELQASGDGGGWERRAFDALWGEGVPGRIVSTSIIVLSLLNFYVYALATEAWKADGYGLWGLDVDARTANRAVQRASLAVFVPITAARIAVIHVHPAWKAFGRSASWRYSLSDLYIVLEIAAILSSSKTWLTGDARTPCLNINCLFLVRSFEMLERSGMGLGVRRIKHVVMEDGKLLFTATVFALVGWLVMSGLYFTANRNNTSGDGAVWDAAVYNGEPWRKFESIPSTMWFVLLNLMREHPLAGAFEFFWARLWVCVSCFTNTLIFALPVSLFQAALFKAEVQDGDEHHETPEALPEGSLSAEEAQEPETATQEWHRGRWWVTLGLSLGSILTYFMYTARATDHASILGIPVKVGPRELACEDGIIALVFLLEWCAHLFLQGTGYAFSALGTIDILAWLPGLVHATLVWRAAPCSEWWRAACVLRALKLERYLGSFRDIYHIILQQRQILSATLLLSFLLWMIFSMVLFWTEQDNPDSEMRGTYGSMLRSLWAEVINLHGEWPWADYTATGKGVGTFIGIFSIALFCVPISIFGDGFEKRISTKANPEDKELPWQQLCRPQGDPEGIRCKAYDLLYAHLHHPPAGRGRRFVVLRALSVTMTLLTTYTTMMGTLDDGSLVDWIIDLLASVFFLCEFAGRTVATGWRHPCSFIGLCDVLSLWSFCTMLGPAWRKAGFHPQYQKRDVLHMADDCMVLLRLLRLFCLESYFMALHTLRNVLYINRWAISKAGGTLMSIWFIHATLLYLFEGPEVGQEAGECDEMSFRYRSIISALQYSIVHLFGDYPETDYSFKSKIVHIAGIMGGIAIIASFCGVFSASFINYLEDQREQEFIEAGLKRTMAVANVVRSVQRKFRQKRAQIASVAISEPRVQQSLPCFTRLARNTVCGLTPGGCRLMLVFHCTLVVALLNTMVNSMPEVDNSNTLESWGLVVEGMCTLVFIFEYMLQVIATPSRLLHPWRLLDLACLLPGPCLTAIHLATGNPRLEAVFEALSMLRALRIMEFPYFRREVKMIGQALSLAGGKLIIPGYLALNVWVTTSALFMWLENYYQSECTSYAASMRSLPEAMYWCCIFLIGEWANVDFSFAGSRLCIFYVLIGIALFSIPVGIIVEAVQSTMELAAEEEKEVRLLLGRAQKAQVPQKRATVAEVIRRMSAAGSPARTSRLSVQSTAGASRRSRRATHLLNIPEL